MDTIPINPPFRSRLRLRKPTLVVLHATAGSTIPINPPFRSRLRLRKPTLVVLHATAGSTLSGAVSTLRARGLGYHYLIDKAGRVYKGCATNRNCGHAGNSYGPEEERRGVSRVQDSGARFVAGCSVNAYSVGVSFVNRNDGVDAITDAQWAACRELLAALKVAVPSLQWVASHAVVSPGRKTDPRGVSVDAICAGTGLRAWRYGQ